MNSGKRHNRLKVDSNSVSSEFNVRLTPISLMHPEFFENRDILEVGCGPQAEIHYLEGTRLRLGLDPLAGEFSHLYPGGVHLIQGAGEHLPFGDGAFDIVLCLNVIDHGLSPDTMLREAYRVVKLGGALLLGSNTFTTRVFRKTLELIDRFHPHHLSDAELYNMIRDAGFRITQHTIANVNPGVGTTLPMFHMKQLGTALILGMHHSLFQCMKSPV